ncbi:hypothetical protein [Vibrio parahaemolyticus]|uniref:hypothetical protein n=1 Tax=Vibrio parahaemolyticus TaxID=670 RepID=UPI0011214C0A|nr:hypothetical protein [Vibrio parahaemolyticus]
MVSPIVSIAIDQGPVIELSDRTPTATLTVTGTYSDGTTGDVTSEVVWDTTEAVTVYNLKESRITMSDNTVQTLPTASRTATIKHEAKVIARIGVLSDKATVLQCTTGQGPAVFGTCLVEFDNTSVYNGVGLYTPSAAALEGYFGSISSEYYDCCGQTHDVDFPTTFNKCALLTDLTGTRLRDANETDIRALIGFDHTKTGLTHDLSYSTIKPVLHAQRSAGLRIVDSDNSGTFTAVYEESHGTKEVCVTE